MVEVYAATAILTLNRSKTGEAAWRRAVVASATKHSLSNLHISGNGWFATEPYLVAIPVPMTRGVYSGAAFIHFATVIYRLTHKSH